MHMSCSTGGMKYTRAAQSTLEGLTSYYGAMSVEASSLGSISISTNSILLLPPPPPSALSPCSRVYAPLVTALPRVAPTHPTPVSMYHGP